jgi:hypothetical protein
MTTTAHTAADFEARFPAGATVSLHGRKLKVDGVIAAGPNTQRYGTACMIGLVGPRGAIYAANGYTDGTVGDLISLPRI